jgi:hypothetical protein
MTAQIFWLILGVFVLGLFVGSNLGILLICLLQASGEGASGQEDWLSVPAEAEG